MRVGVHADPAAHQIPGGVGMYVRNLLTELLKDGAGAAVQPILSNHADVPLAWSAADLIRTPLPFGVQYAAWNYLGQPKISKPLDVVHATGLAIPPVPGAALVATIHDLAVEHMPEVVPPPWRQIYRRGLRRAVGEAAVICAVSQATRTELVERFSVDPDRIHVTPEAPNVTPQSRSDPAILERLGLDCPFILNLSTVEPRKNQVRLIRAFAAASSELDGFKLVIAGVPGWAQEEVETLIQSQQLTTRVILPGKVSNAELVALYGKASVFAFPSLYEGFGLPLIEALGFGIPSVASTSPALRELGSDAALYVDPADTEDLGNALVQLASDEALRERLSEAGKLRAAGYTWERTAAATMQAYTRAAGG